MTAAIYIPPSVSPGGSTGQLQFNKAGAFGGVASSFVDSLGDVTFGTNLYVAGASMFDNGQIATDGFGDLTVNGALDVLGPVILGVANVSPGRVFLYSNFSTFYTELVGGAAASNFIMILPTTIGASGQFLTTDGINQTSWANGPSPATPSGAVQVCGFGSSSTSFAAAPGWGCDSLGQMTATSQGATLVPLTIQGDPSQSGSLQNWNTFSGNVLSVTAAGGIVANVNSTFSITNIFGGGYVRFANTGNISIGTFATNTSRLVVLSSGGLQLFPQNFGTPPDAIQLYNTDQSTVMTRITNTGRLSIQAVATSAGNNQTLTITPPGDSSITAGANSPNVLLAGSSRQWATGAIALQGSSSFGADTYTADGDSTMTLGAGAVFNPPVAGTHMTINNAVAIDCNGPLLVGGNLEVSGTSSATVGVGTIAGKLPIYGITGSLLGYLPIYSSIT